MVNSKWILLISYLLLPGFAARAQNTYLRHFTVKDGLPSNTVYDVYSDSKGYLWFGTDKGIARFNGTWFDYFTTSDGLPDNDVFCFKEDKQRRLWISTYSGTLCYFKDNKFYTAENTPFLSLPFKNIQGDISVASDSSITILFQGIECKFVSIRGDKVTQYDFGKFKSTVQGNPLKVVRIPHKGYKLLYPGMWVEIDDNGKFLRRYRSRKPFTAAYTRTQDRPLLYAEGYIYDIDERKLQCISDHVERYKSWLVAHWEPRQVFICTSNGVFINNMHLLPQSHAVSLTPDIEGNYWIATINEGGAYWLNKNLVAVKEYKEAYNGKVIYVKKIGDKFFFVTDNEALYCWANGKSRRIYANKQVKKKVGEGRVSVPLITDDQNYFFFGRDHYYWIKDINNIKIVVSKRMVMPSRGWPKYVIAVDSNFYYLQRDSVAIIPSSDGLFRLRPKEWGERIPTQSRVLFVAPDPKNDIWIATLEGLRKLRDKKIVVQPQIKFTFRQFGFYHGCLVGYTNKNLLLLIRNYESSNPHVDTLQSNNAIWDGMYPIDADNIIFTANNYCCLLTFSSQYKEGYKVSFIENAFIPADAEYITADTANCYFFKDNTITTIRKSALFEQRPPPRILFTKIKTQHGTFPVDSVVSIPYKQARDIRIEFDYIAYNASQINCQYTITIGNIENWKDINGERAINLLNTGYGNYEIRLRAKTLSSNYSSVQHFILIVERPFWVSWWFISLCVLCFLITVSGVIIIVIKYLLRKKQEKYTTEMKVRKSEFKALNALMNPHFIFNSLNNIQNLINKKDVDKANKYLVIFSKLVRQNMHNIEREYISLDKEIQLVSNYLKLEQLRFKELLNYDIILEVPETELEEIVIPALLLQPLVENAIKHGLQPARSPENYLLLRIYEQENVLFIEIQDNGVGIIGSRNRSLNLAHESFALNNIQQRIDYYNSLYSRKITFMLEEITEGEMIKGSRATIKITLT